MSLSLTSQRRRRRLAVLLLALTVPGTPTRAFLLTTTATTTKTQRQCSRVAIVSKSDSIHDDEDNRPRSSTTTAAIMDRRHLLQRFTAATLSIATMAPTAAQAGIDVSGLPVQGGGSSAGNAALRQQLQAYDGSGATRVQEIIKAQASSNQPTSASFVAQPPVGVATWALRATEPTLQSIKLGTWSRYQGQVVSPEGPMARNWAVSFDFPSDWLALDRVTGCIQYVDQRNGDKVYLLRVTLPDNDNDNDNNESSSLATISKSFIANAIFDPQGSIVKTGQPIEDFKATGAQTLSEEKCRGCPIHRRFKVKYATVTGNGLRVERRGLMDAYQLVGSKDVYMCMTSSNANKFEKGGVERETVESIVDSFRIERY